MTKQSLPKLLIVALLAAGFVAVLGLAFLLARTPVVRADPVVIYVDHDAPGADDGSSWADAYVSLQDGLNTAISGHEIWVAEGVYTPTNATDRTATFLLLDEVAVYGGFGGYGVGETARAERDWVANLTVLSGDIGTTGDSSDNAYHVVTGSGVTTTAVLDGFTVTGGNADGLSPHHEGGGMYNSSGSPTVRNVTFTGNSASNVGGGMLNDVDSSPILVSVTFSDNEASVNGGGMVNRSRSHPTLVNVIFEGNHADNAAGGMRNTNSHPTLINVAFSGNTAEKGGGMYNYNSHPTLVNVTFSGNVATEDGGGIYNEVKSSPRLSNCILWGNTATLGSQIHNSGTVTVTVTYCDVEGDYAGEGNINSDPLFVDADGPDDIAGNADDDLRLRATSPAIDAGDNAAVLSDSVDLDGDGDTDEPQPLDLASKPRFADIASMPDTGNGTPPIVDMGAYETPVRVYLPLVLRNTGG